MYKNPILYADYSDPDVIRVNDDFYMVASSFTYLPGVPLLHSKDLVHWEIINYCVPSLPFEKYNVPVHGSGTWAPSIRYHEGTFYVFVPLVDEGIFVARSKDPYGTFELNCLKEARGWIDPCPLWDDDGKAYMVFAYANSRCGIKHRLSVVEIDCQCTEVLTEPKVIFDGKQIAPTIEGPKFHKKGDYYYIFAPAGGVETGWQSVLRSRNVYGPYEYKIVLHQGNTNVNGPHQGAWVCAIDGKEWFVHFQDVIELGRITHLQPVCWNDGWPFIGVETNGDGIGEPVEEWNEPIEGAPKYKIATSDDFDKEVLNLQWQWQANPCKDFYSLSKEKGALTLFCRVNDRRENLLWYAPNALTQIPQSCQFIASTKISLEGEQSGDFAGMGIIGHQYAYVGIEKTENGYALKEVKGIVQQEQNEGLAQEEVVTGIPVSSNDIWLKMELYSDKLYSFSYSEDGIHYTRLKTAHRLFRATWTGAKLCLWAANRNNVSSKGYGKYDYFTVEDTANCKESI